ncbi:MAG: RDD family protein [Clostridia bacterium]|nr:RDD family protein [Clostridia bacterium]
MGIIIRRFFSFYIDLMIASFSSVIVCGFVGKLYPNEEQFMSVFVYLVIGMAIILFLIKDISGRSVGKRIFRLIIIDRKMNTSISKSKLILRNILAFLWILDGILIYEGVIKYKIMDKALGLDVVPKSSSSSNSGGRSVVIGRRL